MAKPATRGVLAAATRLLATLGALAFLTFGSTSAWAAGEPSPPPASAPVADRADILSSSIREALDQQLGIDNQSAKGQLAVLTVQSTDATPIAVYAQDVFNQWGIGHSRDNDGVLVVVAAKDRHMRIQTGKGLSARLSNPTAQKIINVDALPEFRIGDYNAGVLNTIIAVRADLKMPASSALTRADSTLGAPLSAPAPGGSPHSGGHTTLTALGWVGAAVLVLGAAALFVRWGRRRPPGGGYPGSPGSPGIYYTGTSNVGSGGFGGGSSDGGGATGSW